MRLVHTVRKRAANRRRFQMGPQGNPLGCSHQTGVEIEVTGADIEKTGADNEETGAEIEETRAGADIEETGADIEETGADNEETGADNEETGADIEETGADNEETRADNEETGADIEETGADNEETRADNEETGADIEETGADNEETGADIEETGADIEETGADNEETGADIKETGADNEETRQSPTDMTRQYQPRPPSPIPPVGGGGKSLPHLWGDVPSLQVPVHHGIGNTAPGQIDTHTTEDITFLLTTCVVGKCSNSLFSLSVNMPDYSRNGGSSTQILRALPRGSAAHYPGDPRTLPWGSSVQLGN